MKIFEIKNCIINEGAVEPNLLMSLQNIVKRGKIDNTFEYIVVARVLQLLKNGMLFSTSNPLFEPSLTTSKEVLDLLKTISPTEQSKIACQLLQTLTVLNRDQINSYANPNHDYASWLKLYTASEANE